MSIPIERMLNNKTQIALARVEDAIVRAIYEIDRNIVMHGGTAIWRCYGGRRFSSDVDVYLSEKQLKEFDMELTWKVSKYQLKHGVPSSNRRRVEIYNDEVRTKLEAMKPPHRLEAVPALYELADGTKMTIKTLSVDGFIKEKMSTYERRMYARDFFDVYQLVINNDVGSYTKKSVLRFVGNAERPKDEDVLKDIVYIGAAPTFDEMVNAIRGKLK